MTADIGANDEWRYVNWYATRLHLLERVEGPDEYGRRTWWALCGADVYTLVEHAKQRKKWAASAKDYGTIPHCKRCAREASKA